MDAAMRVQDSDGPVVGLTENMSYLKCPDCETCWFELERGR